MIGRLDTERKLNVLFLCTGNSCRSQMAEGWGHFLWDECCKVYSAGIETHGLNPYAVKVMAEEGINISNYRSKTLSSLDNVQFDLVITVCDNAQASCPQYQGDTVVLHKAFDDPPRLAAEIDSEEHVMECYRIVRDEIYEFIKELSPE